MSTLKVQKRNLALKPKQLRRKGVIPAVLVGKNLDASISIQLDQKTAERFLKKNHIGSQTDLDLSGKTYLAMLKNVTYETLSHDLEHLEFQVLTAGESVKTTAPIRFINKEKASSDGIVNEMINKIELECLPKDIPDEIVVDLAGLEIGDSIAAGDLDITKDERFKMLTSAESLLVNVTAPTLQAEAEEEEAGEESVEVPVIGKEEE